jgi:pimeloyl-ACP methyl ester carboxylesterase
MHLAYRDLGAGRPVVLLHAFPFSSAMWLDQRERLSGHCRVITPDQRGFGGSPLGADEPALEHCVEDLRRLLDRLHLDRVVLGGLSMGGYVAMAFLRAHPERVEALLLADTRATADPPDAAARRLDQAERVLVEGSDLLVPEQLPALLGATTTATRPELVERVTGWLRAAPSPAVAWAQRAMAARPDSFDVLRRAAVPATVVVGAEDVMTPPSDAQALVEALPAAKLTVLSGAGHLSAVETPDAFSRAVLELLG